ncbi:IS30 family transposase [Microlunatus sagamiharensis]|uniref:IS30 family transposase n=1 Tax=Microlunatus sagamiharensis TaxID=546874 RepID=UPI0038B3A43E
MQFEPCQVQRYLSRDERYEIARLHDSGLGVREIGRRLGRSGSTISRELRRPERDAGVPGRPSGRTPGYQPEACHQAAVRARNRPRASRLASDARLRVWVQARLDLGLSPEQISGRLRVEFEDDEQMRISHEAIYRAIYVLPRGELRRELRAHLRTGRSQRKTRQSRTPRNRPGQIVGAVSIHERPEEVEGRLVPGHHEGDLVCGPAGTTAAIGTLVERTSGFLTAFLLPERHTAEATLAGLSEAVNRTGWPMASLTWDRGSEMARHAEFSTATGIQVYFADPHAPLAARLEREHERLAARVRPQRTRHRHRHRQRTPTRRRAAQQPAPQTPQLPHTHRSPRRHTQRPNRCCDHPINLGPERVGVLARPH